AGIKTAVLTHEALHGWHVELELIRDCLDSSESQPARLCALGDRSSLHVNCLRPIGFGELGLLLVPGGGGEANQDSRTEACVGGGSVLRIHHMTGLKDIAYAQCVVQVPGKAYRKNDRWPIQANHRLGSTARCYRPDSATNRHARLGL